MADDFFDDDFDEFNSVVRSFFGEPARRSRKYKSQEEDSEIGFIETPEKVYLIFEMPGFSEKDILIKLKDRSIEVQAKKHHLSHVKDYLAHKLEGGIIISRTLPSSLNQKNFTHTFKNGILEVSFNKK